MARCSRSQILIYYNVDKSQVISILFLRKKRSTIQIKNTRIPNWEFGHELIQDHELADFYLCIKRDWERRMVFGIFSST